MKLFWSPRSPYVRKVMVTAHEANLAGKIETTSIVVSGMSVSTDFHATNPLARIPTLITEDGEVLFDSSVICEYFDSLGGGHSQPAEGKEHWQVKRNHAIGTGMMDNLLPVRGEVLRPAQEQSAGFIKAGEEKFMLCCDWLDKNIGTINRPQFDLGQIAIGTGLAYADFRFPHLDWRKNRANLAGWAERVHARPSFVSTQHIDK